MRFPAIHGRRDAVLALQGKREQALRAPERAVALGWQYDDHGTVPRLADEPVYRSLRNEPRLRRLDAIIQGAVARERREVRALDI